MIYLMRHGQDNEDYIGGWSELSLIEEIPNVAEGIEKYYGFKPDFENAKRYLTDTGLLNEVEKKVRENFAKAFEQSLGEEVPDEDEEEPEE